MANLGCERKLSTLQAFDAEIIRRRSVVDALPAQPGLPNDPRVSHAPALFLVVLAIALGTSAIAWACA